MLFCFGRSAPDVGLWRCAVPFTLTLLALLFAATACEPGGQASGPGAADSVQAAGSEEGEEASPEYRYEAVMQGMLRDTLRGGARFGVIFDPATRREQWIVAMHSGSDVTSGVYLARPDTARPQAGTYEIVSRPPAGRYDSLRAASKETFTMIYRTGMRRSFHSQSGTVELTTATDTLIEGTFRATLQGTASPPGQPPREGTVTLRGDFRAEKRTVGFMFGV